MDNPGAGLRRGIGINTLLFRKRHTSRADHGLWRQPHPSRRKAHLCPFPASWGSPPRTHVQQKQRGQGQRLNPQDPDTNFRTLPGRWLEVGEE